MIEFIKALIRPLMVVAFVVVFLAIVLRLVPLYFNQSMADLVFKTFIDAVVLIIGIWIGGRLAKTP
jgi:hypothetical protein